MSTGDPRDYSITATQVQRQIQESQSAIHVWQKPMLDAITRLHEYQFTPQITMPADVFYNWQISQSNPNLLLLLED